MANTDKAKAVMDVPQTERSQLVQLANELTTSYGYVNKHKRNQMLKLLSMLQQKLSFQLLPEEASQIQQVERLLAAPISNQTTFTKHRRLLLQAAVHNLLIRDFAPNLDSMPSLGVVNSFTSLYEALSALLAKSNKSAEDVEKIVLAHDALAAKLPLISEHRTALAVLDEQLDVARLDVAFDSSVQQDSDSYTIPGAVSARYEEILSDLPVVVAHWAFQLLKALFKNKPTHKDPEFTSPEHMKVLNDMFISDVEEGEFVMRIGSPVKVVVLLEPSLTWRYGGPNPGIVVHRQTKDDSPITDIVKRVREFVL
ncbi:hypothetical protein CAOG_04709 [Capsaspora owczarzaki ATCC 30864]|uniref:Uncharacterized protein n=1 Tax=Capsaspora owczarzaki (strain ATCC 30864) TaxID=595528 RepID=A0A0D2VSE8_CAPO3|nr:hypothetical protein CAOG_04709 [Capsaspora owczarzaki ATCC 30864]KJE94007.1 hypothetical protein CAOG_004709 [Capsaspora owczarzaki ATCC 30864]|eukprot:XP_004347456.2 hypothetical protein CAOG_04709 [Capsaspora owczarzaki ATCC 30864]